MKKRLISILLIIAVTTTFLLPSDALTQQQQNHTYTITDVLNILKSLAGISSLTSTQRSLYNLTPPASSVTINDVLEILKHLAGVESVLGPARPSGNAEANEVVRLVNIERQKAGLPALSSSNTALNSAAMKRAEEIRIDYRSDHSRPDGRAWSTVFAEFNITYRNAGENIAQGQRTAQEVVNAWMNSPGHRANILNSNFTEIGVGVVRDSNGRASWVQLFIRPR
jgi:uncharacterized protein YkwD